MPIYTLAVASESSITPEVHELDIENYRKISLITERAGEQTTTRVKIRDDDVVALEFDGGFKLWMRGDDLDATMGKAPSRGVGDDVRELQAGLPLAESERGAGTWLLKGLEIFGIEPHKDAALAIAEALDRNNGDQLLQRDESAKGGWAPVQGAMPAPPQGSAVLLFIHGTFSSTDGSFGDLFRDPLRVRRLRRRYQDRIYGFEHSTLKKSPIENLLDLVPLLPDDIDVHLVSHSRGGLVGDLLAFGARSGGTPIFSEDDLSPFNPSKADGGDNRREQLEKLGALLAKKHIRIGRFVRVASPSRGTSLASGRLDRWLSIIGNLAELVPGPAGALVGGFLDFTLAVVKERTNPESLPGLAAMMPGSPLVQLLNRSDAKIPGSLSVIAGDIEAKGIWDKAKLLIPDLFFAGEHDLVVNTGSMYGGPAYAERRYLFDRGPEVTHFTYFVNESTASGLQKALLEPEPASGFLPITPAMAVGPARGKRTGAENRPVLFVLPGIMGSKLSVDGDALWLNLFEVARGGLDRLRFGSQKRVRAEGLLEMAYGDLLVYFDESHDVVDFPYDWRLSIEESANELAVRVESKLDQAERHDKPLRILAHSMGGLVARAMIAARPDLWKRIRRHPDGRLLMLGTPNGGSWEIVRLLVARAATLKKLALLDLTHDREELLRIINAFPGVLELIPEDARDLFSKASWSALHRDDEAGHDNWTLPGQRRANAAGKSQLERAGEVRRRLRDRAIDPIGMIYVAGQATATPCDVRTGEVQSFFLGDSRKELQFLASPRGDGSVLWDNGPLPGVATWYMAGVEHGDLANHRAMFPALRDLLAEGSTDAMPRRAPVTRGASDLFPMPEHEPSYYPDERSVLTSALAMGPPRREALAQPKVRVSVVHGNLAFAQHTVAVGHYRGDTIIAAEAYLDRVLGGRMRAHQDLGLYPGALRTVGIFPNPDPASKPKGALVAGLGQVGELTPAELSASFAHALLAFARERLEGRHESVAEEPDKAPETLDVPLTTVLIGTGAGGISIEHSVHSLLRGVVRANALLEEAGQIREVRISELEFFELWEDLAIRAGHALAQVNQDPELAGAFECQPTIKEGEGRHGGLRPYSDPDWWHRLQITSDGKGSLKFTSLTQRARAEQSLLATQRELVDRFVERAIGSTTQGPDTNRTLFEMLLPNRLKDGSEFRTNLVLVVDEDAARFPWEMLEDRWSDGGNPPAVEYGIIRQLSTESFRDRPTIASRGRALVIGDPKSIQVPLLGAQREAEAVRDQLSAMNIRVNAKIRADAETIVAALHQDSYQILHLAGHGIHDDLINRERGYERCTTCGQTVPPAREDRVSGMIIGDAIVLTPADVKQMRQVPELVFINCCHLGRTDAPTGKGPRLKEANRLAANLAVQFIEMGVRAVVAAGWAVNDKAAEAFSAAFYRHMGEYNATFGTAVKKARREIWRDFSATNTWGAYQCYGDPDFRIRRHQTAQTSKSEPSDYVSPAEGVADLSNLTADALTATRIEISGLRERLSAIEGRLDRAKDPSGEDWRIRGDILEALGLVYGELGLFRKAVDYLNRAIQAEDVRVTWRAIEQRARFHARWAKELHANGDSPQALEEFQRALEDLDSLPPAGDDRLTTERYRSRTAIYSRRVQALPPTQRKDELESLIGVYDKVSEQQGDVAEDPLTPYSRLLWLTGKLLLTGYSRQTLEESCPDFEDWCDELETRTRPSDVSERGLWNDVLRVEVQLLRALRHGEVKEHADRISRSLASAMNRGASNRQFSSILNNLDLLYTLCASATVNRRRFGDQASALGEIRRKLVVQSGNEQLE